MPGRFQKRKDNALQAAAQAHEQKQRARGQSQKQKQLTQQNLDQNGRRSPMKASSFSLDPKAWRIIESGP